MFEAPEKLIRFIIEFKNGIENATAAEKTK